LTRKIEKDVPPESGLDLADAPRLQQLAQAWFDAQFHPHQTTLQKTILVDFLQADFPDQATFLSDVFSEKRTEKKSRKNVPPWLARKQRLDERDRLIRRYREGVLGAENDLRAAEAMHRAINRAIALGNQVNAIARIAERNQGRTLSVGALMGIFAGNRTR
jgi:hypothetical protein